MQKRIVAIYFPHLITDWMLRKHPELKDIPFALAQTEKGRRVIKAVNIIAKDKGVFTEMVVADCKAILPELQVFDYEEEQLNKLLNAIAEWCIRYAPIVAVDLPDGLIIDATGCTHLWSGEEEYLKDIQQRLCGFGYHVNSAMADTAACAWAVSRFARNGFVVPSGRQIEVLNSLPAAALRVESSALDKLHKLGLKTIGSFMKMPRTAVRRRFGSNLLARLDQALGYEMELIEAVNPPSPYEERLPCLEPVRTDSAIEIAVKLLLDKLCERLTRESMGLRKCILRCFRLDAGVQKIEIGTSRPVRNVSHLFKLIQLKIGQINPGLGIELFTLEAPAVEELLASQDALWAVSSHDEGAVAELIDKLTGKLGEKFVSRYLPAEHYWPERAVKQTYSLSEKASTEWRNDLPRPVHLLIKPEKIEVTVPIPDYPPMMFKYKNALHTIAKADGPERIEQEWWIQQGVYRDYYCVEDDKGGRYWLFRSGDYNKNEKVDWFIHGFFG